MRKFPVLLLSLLLLFGCESSADKDKIKKVTNLGNEVFVNVNGELFTVRPEKIIQVLPFRGNIPPINKPKFIAADETGFLREDDMVIGLSISGIVKAYPVKILQWHVVVNDYIGEEPVLVSYDPLSDLAAAYRRTVLGRELEFKTSDRIYNSNPVLLDDATKTRWSQFLGEAIMGRLAGQKLASLPVAVTTWKGWKSEHPETVVLSMETGANRDYDRKLYEDYYNVNHLLYEVEHEDDRLPNKIPVYGIEVEGRFKAYPAGVLQRKGTIRDEVAGIPVTLDMNESGIVTALRGDRGEGLPIRRLLWFSWAAFHPETEIYTEGS